MSSAPFPDQPPFALRARLFSALPDAEYLWLPDGVIEVDEAGRIRRVHAAADTPRAAESAIDLRPLVVMPGLVDTHVHIPQVPAAGLGAGMDLLAWLERYVFPLEHDFDVPAAQALAPQVYRAMAAVGTTTISAYAAVWPDSTDACFGAAEEHGIRATIGNVLMDRLSYDDRTPPARILENAIRASAELCERWHGAADGRLRYAFTPRFAVSCTADMLRESASLAAHYGATWQTHLAEDAREMAAVAEHFAEAEDYLDVYDRAGGLGRKALLAHAIHLSDREVGRLVETDSAVAHCPVSNMFIRSGVMPLARYLDAGLRVGLGTDVAGAPELSVITQMRLGFLQHNSRAVLVADERPIPGPLEWLRLGTLGGAQALGLDDVIGSLEPGKEADLIAVDPERGRPPNAAASRDVDEIASRLIFRERAGMVRAAWVRGRRLEGPEAA
ncbi:MAG: amidohydrolase family protein [Candidatus Limnocylindrales bacterium]